MSVIFSRACEYAMRALIEMAKDDQETSWTVPVIAKKADAPAPFLAKTFQSLVRGGILNSMKGRKGGFSFARPANEIPLMDIVEIIDGTRLTYDCALGVPDCHDDSPCPFHVYWRKIREPLVEALTEEPGGHLGKGSQAKALGAAKR